MEEEIILKDNLTRFGLRRLHVIKMGGPVAPGNWIDKVPTQSSHTVFWHEWEEKGVGMHHLLICWKAREVVTVFDPSTRSGGDKRTVVMWWIDVKGGDTIRKAADEAACMFSALYPWMPTKCALKKLPVEAATKKLDEPFQAIEFVEEEWVPQSFVAVW